MGYVPTKCRHRICLNIYGKIYPNKRAKSSSSNRIGGLNEKNQNGKSNVVKINSNARYKSRKNKKGGYSMIYLGKDIGYVKCAWCESEATQIGMLQKICEPCFQKFFEHRMKYGR